MPAPVAPYTISVSLNQNQIDALWAVIETDFPDATGPQILAQLKDWARQGIESGVAASIRRRARTVSETAADDFSLTWNA